MVEHEVREVATVGLDVQVRPDVLHGRCAKDAGDRQVLRQPVAVGCCTGRVRRATTPSHRRAILSLLSASRDFTATRTTVAPATRGTVASRGGRRVLFVAAPPSRDAGVGPPPSPPSVTPSRSRHGPLRDAAPGGSTPTDFRRHPARPPNASTRSETPSACPSVDVRASGWGEHLPRCALCSASKDDVRGGS